MNRNHIVRSGLNTFLILVSGWNEISLLMAVVVSVKFCISKVSISFGDIEVVIDEELSWILPQGKLVRDMDSGVDKGSGTVA